MDKMVHTALNSLKMILQNQQITAQNISNASVVGYRRDSNSEFGTVYLNSDVQEFQANTSNNEGKPLFKYEFDVTESL